MFFHVRFYLFLFSSGRRRQRCLRDASCSRVVRLLHRRLLFLLLLLLLVLFIVVIDVIKLLAAALFLLLLLLYRLSFVVVVVFPRRLAFLLPSSKIIIIIIRRRRRRFLPRFLLRFSLRSKVVLLFRLVTPRGLRRGRRRIKGFQKRRHSFVDPRVRTPPARSFRVVVLKSKSERDE